MSRMKHAAGVLAVMAVVAAGEGAAETKATLHYPYEWVFSSAVRLVKIDLKGNLEEENKASGYIIFWYEYNGLKSYASMEFVDLTSDENGYSVNVRLVLDKLPSWVEEDLLEKLELKIKDLYGSPPTYKKKKPSEDEDDGEDQEKDKDKKEDKEKKDDPDVD
jgi:hypothetical protein